MTSSRKRRHEISRLHAHGQLEHTNNLPENDSGIPVDSALFIQAHEADIVHGTQAKLAARSLEVLWVNGIENELGTPGDGLIALGATDALDLRKWAQVGFDEEDEGDLPGPAVRQRDEKPRIWVDRYDARLLLHATPSANHSNDGPLPESPGCWSDLPSDTEDTFFFSPLEAEDFRREKRRRLFDKHRTDRLKAMCEDDSDGEDNEEDTFGGSDEEPDDTLKDFMKRTAIHISSSHNPAQLEMRILANHGKDKRFAFLRGRWSRTWKKIRNDVLQDRLERDGAPARATGLGGLAEYASEDSDQERADEDIPEIQVGAGEGQQDPVLEKVLEESEDEQEMIKKARRVRAKAWAQERRALRASKP